MSKKSRFHRGQAAEIPPSQRHNFKMSNDYKSNKKLPKDNDSFMLILRLLIKKPSRDIAYTGEPSKYYKLKKIASTLKHIEKLEIIINDLIRCGFIEKSLVEDKIRITVKGLNYYYRNS